VLIQPVGRKEFEQRTFPHEYDVLVYQEGGHVYAKDRNGNVICVDSPTACIQEAVTAVGENSVVRIRGDFRNYKLTIQGKSKIDVIFDWLNRIEIIGSNNIGIFGKVVGNNGILIKDSSRITASVKEVYGSCDTPAIEIRAENAHCGWHKIEANTVATAPYFGPACGVGILFNPMNNWHTEGNTVMVHGTIFGSDIGVQLNARANWNRIFVDVDNGPAGGTTSVLVNKDAEYILIVLWGFNSKPPIIYGRNVKVFSQMWWDVVPDNWIDNWQSDGWLDTQNTWHYTIGYKQSPGYVKGTHISSGGFINLFYDPNLPDPVARIVFSDNLITRASKQAQIKYNTNTDVLQILANTLRLDAINRDPPLAITINPSSTYTVTVGIYYAVLDANTVAEVNINDAWYTVIPANGTGILIADKAGTVRLRNTSTTATSTATLVRVL